MPGRGRSLEAVDGGPAAAGGSVAACSSEANKAKPTEQRRQTIRNKMSGTNSVPANLNRRDDHERPGPIMIGSAPVVEDRRIS